MQKIILALLVSLAFLGCKKTSDECKNVVVTLSATSCKHVGIIIDGKTFPSDDLADQYAIEGKRICIDYSYWDDLSLCPCCGGKKVHVIAVH